jgi:F-type H+-transporting ATPase subunit delta
VAGLREIARLLAESADLRRVLENPAVPAEQKRNLLDAIVQREGIDKRVRNLVAVLMDHRRVHFLPRIIEQLEKELDARLGFAEAQISSARELGDEEKRALEAQIEKTTGKKVRVQYALDSSLLGGAVVRVGSTIYDGSVKGQLERIREAISS